MSNKLTTSHKKFSSNFLTNDKAYPIENISCSVDPHFLPNLSPDWGELVKELVLLFVSGVVDFWRVLVESLGTGGLDGSGVEKKPGWTRGDEIRQRNHWRIRTNVWNYMSHMFTIELFMYFLSPNKTIHYWNITEGCRTYLKTSTAGYLS